MVKLLEEISEKLKNFLKPEIHNELSALEEKEIKNNQ